MGPTRPTIRGPHLDLGTHARAIVSHDLRSQKVDGTCVCRCGCAHVILGVDELRYVLPNTTSRR